MFVRQELVFVRQELVCDQIYSRALILNSTMNIGLKTGFQNHSSDHLDCVNAIVLLRLQWIRLLAGVEFKLRKPKL